ncbi:DUF732 domain-containing protein [Mycobacterium bohemicum]|uniref:DUF732 domain-containing protein n=1 Tax=Mycobacterium bohemicum TaxID=56425 RepID=UPI001FEBF6B4|nr:DUF732 domain-containing protein [Mycobacterium bohemicum]
MKSSTICAVLLSAAALFSAVPASADATDDAFIGALQNYGIGVNNRDSAIATGHDVCAALDSGQDSSFLVMDVIRDTHLPAKKAGFYVGVSVAAYCPQYKGTLDPSLNWLLPGFLPQL